MSGERRTLPERVSVERRVTPDRRDRMRRINTIHFVGIGGSGMSGIAEVLLNLGYRVQGSDLRTSTVTQWLAGLGARVSIGHAAANIATDHLSTHGGDFGLLKQSFVDFLHNLPFYGLAVLCADDEHLRSILQEVGRPILSYGLESGADVRGENLRPAGLQTHFDVRRAAAAPLAVTLNLA